jgi:hypothetical protein
VLAAAVAGVGVPGTTPELHGKAVGALVNPQGDPQRKETATGSRRAGRLGARAVAADTVDMEETGTETRRHRHHVCVSPCRSKATMVTTTPDRSRIITIGSRSAAAAVAAAAAVVGPTDVAILMVHSMTAPCRAVTYLPSPVLYLSSSLLLLVLLFPPTHHTHTHTHPC